MRLRWLYDEGKSTLYAKIMHGRTCMFKAVSVSAHARYHVICYRCPKYLAAVVLNDVDLSYRTFKLDHLVTFAAIFSNTFTAHAQKRLFMNLHYNFWRRHSIPRPRFLYRVRSFGDWVTSLADFCILYAECSPYFYLWFVWPTDLETKSRPYRYSTRVDPTSIHQDWSWYDNTVPSYSVFV